MGVPKFCVNRHALGRSGGRVGGGRPVRLGGRALRRAGAPGPRPARAARDLNSNDYLGTLVIGCCTLVIGCLCEIVGHPGHFGYPGHWVLV